VPFLMVLFTLRPPTIPRYCHNLIKSNGPRPQAEQARSISCASASPRKICHASDQCLHHRLKIPVSHDSSRNLQIQKKFHTIFPYIAPCKCCRNSPPGAGRDRGSRRSPRGGVAIATRNFQQREVFACFEVCSM